jgi:hypothetical protein
MGLNHVSIESLQSMPSGLKIGFLIESMSVACGGPSRVAGNIASALANRGYEVRLYGGDLKKIIAWKYV